MVLQFNHRHFSMRLGNVFLFDLLFDKQIPGIFPTVKVGLVSSFCEIQFYYILMYIKIAVVMNKQKGNIKISFAFQFVFPFILCMQASITSNEVIKTLWWNLCLQHSRQLNKIYQFSYSLSIRWTQPDNTFRSNAIRNLLLEKWDYQLLVHLCRWNFHFLTTTSLMWRLLKVQGFNDDSPTNKKNINKTRYGKCQIDSWINSRN